MERPLAGLLLKAWESLSLSLLSCLCLCLCLCLCFFFFFLCSWWWWWWWWSPCLEDVLSLLSVGMGVPGMDNIACSTEDGSLPVKMRAKSWNNVMSIERDKTDSSSYMFLNFSSISSMWLIVCVEKVQYLSHAWSWGSLQHVQGVVDECLAVMNCVHINIFLLLGGKLTEIEKYYSTLQHYRMKSYFLQSVEII